MDIFFNDNTHCNLQILSQLKIQDWIKSDLSSQYFVIMYVVNGKEKTIQKQWRAVTHLTSVLAKSTSNRVLNRSEPNDYVRTESLRGRHGHGRGSLYRESLV